MKPPSSVDSDGQDAIAQGHQGTGSQSAKRPRPRYSSSRWGRPSPKGSLMGIIQEHLHLRLYVDPILWTPHHIELLNVSVMPSTLGPPHRPTCPRCSCCGRVITGILNLLRLYPYRTDHNLARLIRTTIDSFNLSSGPPLFRVCKHHKLPFYFGGKKQCWVLLPLLVRDISSGVPLVAFTHETERSAVFEARYPRRDVTIQARILAAVVSEINPHDVAILIAMAQDTQRAQPKPPGQGPAFFTVSTSIPASYACSDLPIAYPYHPDPGSRSPLRLPCHDLLRLPRILRRHTQAPSMRDSYTPNYNTVQRSSCVAGYSWPNIKHSSTIRVSQTF
jgi:hypothetical protein